MAISTPAQNPRGAATSTRSTSTWSGYRGGPSEEVDEGGGPAGEREAQRRVVGGEAGVGRGQRADVDGHGAGATRRELTLAVPNLQHVAPVVGGDDVVAADLQVHLEVELRRVAT